MPGREIDAELILAESDEIAIFKIAVGIYLDIVHVRTRMKHQRHLEPRSHFGQRARVIQMRVREHNRAGRGAAQHLFQRVGFCARINEDTFLRYWTDQRITVQTPGSNHSGTQLYIHWHGFHLAGNYCSTLPSIQRAEENGQELGMCMSRPHTFGFYWL